MIKNIQKGLQYFVEGKHIDKLVDRASSTWRPKLQSDPAKKLYDVAKALFNALTVLIVLAPLSFIATPLVAIGATCALVIFVASLYLNTVKKDPVVAEVVHGIFGANDAKAVNDVITELNNDIDDAGEALHQEAKNLGKAAKKGVEDLRKGAVKLFGKKDQ